MASRAALGRARGELSNSVHSLQKASHRGPGAGLIIPLIWVPPGRGPAARQCEPRNGINQHQTAPALPIHINIGAVYLLRSPREFQI